jgi:hypothetical protein
MSKLGELQENGVVMFYDMLGADESKAWADEEIDDQDIYLCWYGMVAGPLSLQKLWLPLAD